MPPSEDDTTNKTTNGPDEFWQPMEAAEVWDEACAVRPPQIPLVPTHQTTAPFIFPMGTEQRVRRSMGHRDPELHPSDRPAPPPAPLCTGRA